MTRHERVRAALGRLARTVCEAEGLGLLDLARGGRAVVERSKPDDPEVAFSR
jgi:hypothetical protein